MKAIATVSMYDMGAANRNGLKHSVTLSSASKFIEQAAQQRDVRVRGRRDRIHQRHARTNSPDTAPIEREFYDFYRTPRGEFTPTGASPELPRSRR